MRRLVLGAGSGAAARVAPLDGERGAGPRGDAALPRLGPLGHARVEGRLPYATVPDAVPAPKPESGRGGDSQAHGHLAALACRRAVSLLPTDPLLARRDSRQDHAGCAGEIERPGRAVAALGAVRVPRLVPARRP